MRKLQKNQIPTKWWMLNMRMQKRRTPKLVSILLSEPVSIARTINLHECGNYQDFAAEINRVHSELTGVPISANPSMADPMPGFNLSYLSPSDDFDAPSPDPGNQPWEMFSAVLDLIAAVPNEN
ncbi:hypothetical protein Patl1_30391 [Pistacia atlantica]|uniref:Uncharacterized protein n=1 Tax=Pistacia atlantica TaxID=434234 RepID=A0ACC1AAU1_9ROSI|nr:hypothetical protein Patl1_30391 [Pistacia atlantica]